MKLSFSFFFLFIFFNSFSQSEIIGNVSDTISEMPINNARIQIFKIQDSSLLCEIRTNNQGYFSIANIVVDSAYMSINQKGYEEKRIFFLGKKQSVINFETIWLFPEVKLLKEVLIVDHYEQLYYKQDTLIYTVDSSKLKEGANVEYLLKQIPGIKINAQGNIRFNTKGITKVLVDGEEFFGNDVTIATRNLDGNAVESVQIYDKVNETGVGKNEKLKVVNLKLRENSKTGSFGKISAASDFNNYHEGSIFANKFKKSERASFFLVGGNTPYSINREDNIYRMNENNDDQVNSILVNETDDKPLREGMSKILNSGIHYTNKIGAKTKLTINYAYKNNPVKIGKDENSQYQLKDTAYITKSTQEDYRGLEKHFIDVKIKHQTKFNEFQVQPVLILGKMENFNFNKTEFLSSENMVFRTTKTNREINLNNNTYGVNSYFKHLFEKTGRLFRMNLNGSIVQSKSEGFLESTVNSSMANSNDNINQSKRNTGNSQTGNITLFFNEPVSKNAKLEIYYMFTKAEGTESRSTFLLKDVDYAVLDSSLSNNFSIKRTANDFGSKFIYRNKYYTLQMGGFIKHLSWVNINQNTSNEIKKNITKLLPGVNFNFNIDENSHLNSNYSAFLDEPPISFIQPVNDNSDPNHVIKGNPNLQPVFNHNISIEYDLLQAKSERNLWIGANLSKRNNDFASYRVYDSLGRSVETIVNVNGNYSTDLTINYSFPLFSKWLELAPNLNLGFIKNKNFIQGVENTLSTSYTNLGLSCTLRLDTIVFNLTGNYIYNVAKSDVNTMNSVPYNTQNYSCSLELPFFKFFLMETKINYLVNNNRATGFNLNYLIWNISLSKTFNTTKGDFILSFIGNDLLNKNKTIMRTVYNNIITDTRSSIISRYFLLKLAFKFKKR